MTQNELVEYELLKLANEFGKFAIQLGLIEGEMQLALERLQIRRWITLIDISPLAEYPNQLFRIFLASDTAMAWFRSKS
jgi:hypothetical protein